ncbi:MAG: type II toxin-antitoxin system RelE/ParE family toxin [Sphingomonas sp.]|nr:type II toxin-antitoxin system RelE/ParE family toxin [Sphingomonas sp.]
MEASEEEYFLVRLIWSRPAAADLFDIADYYDRIDPRLAIEIIDRVENAPAPLLDNSRIGPVLDEEPEIRRWRIPGTPFLLLYAIRDETIEIRRVRHVASDWRREN